MKRIYIAGRLNGMAIDNHINIHNMIIWSEKVRRLGYAVFVPGLDILTNLVMGDLTYNDLFGNSQPWLAASDAVFVTLGWETSKGTIKEIEYAKSLGIPVFFDLELMDKELGDLR